MRKLIPILFTCLFAVGIAGCDISGEESFGFEQGNTLAIEGLGAPGADPVVIPQDTTTTADTTDVTSVTVSYYVKAFTIDKEYSWTVEGEGAVVDSVYRQGEFLDVTFNQVNEYTISVDDGEYQGSITFTAQRQSNAAAGL